MQLDTEESLLRVLSGPRNLKANRLNECDVDRVGALAIAQMPAHHAREVENANRANYEASMVCLGRHVLALRMANDAKAYAPLHAMLMVEVDARLKYMDDPKEREKAASQIATQAIQEYIVDMCSECSGKRNVPDDLPDEKVSRFGRRRMKECPECGGSGQRRYTIYERAKLMRRPAKDKVVNEKVDDAIDLMKKAAIKTIKHYSEVL